MVKPTDFEDPKSTIYQLLKDNWDSSNTSNVGTPNFATRWINRSPKSPPLVTVTDRNITKRAAGPGFFAIRGDGSGGVNRKRGFVIVNCWVDDVDDPSSGTDPQILLEEMWNEVERIALDNGTGTGDLEALSLSGPEDDVEEFSGWTSLRVFGRLEFEYVLTPT